MISQAVRDAICEQLADGKSLREICRQEGMPGRTTVLALQLDDADFRAKCARAREMQAESAVDDNVALEDDVLNGRIDPQAAKVVLASRQWRASKLASKKYGDKLELGGEMRQVHRIERVVVDPKT